MIIKKSSDEFYCEECDKAFTSKGIGTHVWRIHSKVGQEFSTKQKALAKISKKWNKGLSKETDSRVLQYSKEIKEGYANGRLIATFKGKNHSEDACNKISKSIQKRYESGWLPKAGRCKKIKYVSLIAGEVTLDGTWELLVAKYLDNKNIKWKRNIKRFSYTNLNGKLSHYTPDFFLTENNCYIEVKGYTTELDLCKWKQFTEKLEIWNKDKLKKLDIL